jgi:hypothetical protein
LQVNDTSGKLPPVSTTPAQILPPVPLVFTGDKFAIGVNDTSGKFAASVNDASGKLPPVSTTPTSDCRNLKVNLKAKTYIFVSSTTQR